MMERAGVKPSHNNESYKFQEETRSDQSEPRSTKHLHSAWSKIRRGRAGYNLPSLHVTCDREDVPEKTERKVLRVRGRLMTIAARSTISTYISEKSQEKDVSSRRTEVI